MQLWFVFFFFFFFLLILLIVMQLSLQQSIQQKALGGRPLGLVPLVEPDNVIRGSLLLHILMTTKYIWS